MNRSGFGAACGDQGVFVLVGCREHAGKSRARGIDRGLKSDEIGICIVAACGDHDRIVERVW
jgi:hypothetical protein